MKPWHSMKIEEALHTLNAKLGGLSSEDAKKRLQEYGSNELKKEKRKSHILLFFEQFKNILIIILLIATGLSLALGEVYDAIVIISIVIVSAALGFAQEHRAEKALEALKKMTAQTALVLRDGKEIQIRARDIVPGDILLFSTGDKVAADTRIIEAINLKVDEAPLTGESQSVDKDSKPVRDETPVSDRRNMVFTGTAVVYGRGRGVVTATGMNTEFGKIAEM
ncbi:MAG: HAD-IC family P-type ATPase, partial [Candidatus Hadarchaeum sp.]|nr:HAD-IC family P-type ATPase [Candidatus Hadarchaeum sp.]